MAETTGRIPLHRDDNPESSYQGPTMGYLIAHNLLGHEIIRAYGDRATNGDILDSEELARLREYIQDPSPTGTQTFLQKHGYIDVPGTAPGTAASQIYGSLVGYVIAKDGFSSSERGALTEFFARPEVAAELEGVVPRKVTKEERAKNLVDNQTLEKTDDTVE